MSNNENVTPTMAAILRAGNADYLNAARNGTSGARERIRRPVRLPPPLWETIEILGRKFQGVFPDYYITVNSIVEFLLHEGLSSVLSNPDKQKLRRIEGIPHDIDYGEDAEE